MFPKRNKDSAQYRDDLRDLRIYTLSPLWGIFKHPSSLLFPSLCQFAVEDLRVRGIQCYTGDFVEFPLFNLLDFLALPSFRYLLKIFFFVCVCFKTDTLCKFLFNFFLFVLCSLTLFSLLLITQAKQCLNFFSIYFLVLPLDHSPALPSSKDYRFSSAIQ